MKKTIVYASTTGNTEQMALAVADGAKESGAEVLLVKADEASSADVLASDVILLGSPAMGSEVLEDSMEAFFQQYRGAACRKESRAVRFI